MTAARHDEALEPVSCPSLGRRHWIGWTLAWCALIAALALTAWPRTVATGAWTWLALAAGAALLSGLGCVWSARHLPRTLRIIWSGFAAAGMLWAATQFIRSYGAFAAGEPAGAAIWLDFAALGAAALQASLLFLFAARSRDGYAVVRRLCQFGILLLCLYAVIAFPLHSDIVRAGLPVEETVVAFGYGIIEPSGAIFALVVLLGQGGSRCPRTAALVVAGALLRGVAGLLHGTESLSSAGTTHALHTMLWAGGFALLFFGALLQPVELAARAGEGNTQTAAADRRARLVEIALPILAVLAVVTSRLLITDPIDTRAAAMIIVPTLFGTVLLFSIGELAGRSNEARLRRNAESYRDTLSAILDIVPEAVLGIDRRGIIRLVNGSGEHMFGYGPGELDGLPMEVLIPPAHRARHAELVERFRKQGISLRLGTERAPIQALRRDGTEFPCIASIRRLGREADTWFIVSIHDVTAQLRYSRQIEAARQSADIANRAKSEFLANMSHELRTPLNAIIGFSDVIAQQILTPDAARDQGYARDIRGAGLHLLEIINDILDLSKIEAGRMELTESEVDVPALVEAGLRLVKERAARGEVKVSASLPPNLPRLVGDEVRLKQILINLLSNAIKFTPAQGAVSVSAARQLDGRLALRVADSGVGMSADEIETALSVFGQVDSSLARRHEGTGLGLPLTRKLAQLHQAEFRIESEPGIGTTVTILFPRERLRSPAPEGGAAAGSRAGS